jgi:hypothetical protein
MKKLSLIFAATLVWALPASADETVRSFAKRIPAEAGTTVSVEIPVGSVHIEGTDERQVDLDVRLTCDEGRDRCAEMAKKVRVVYDTKGDRIRIEIKDWPKMSTKGLEAHVRIGMPRDLALDAELGVGELKIDGIEGNLDAEVGVGEVKVTMPESAVATVNLDTGVGEANLRAGGRRYESAGLFTKELSWRKGTGKAQVEVECGVGEISVALK